MKAPAEGALAFMACTTAPGGECMAQRRQAEGSMVWRATRQTKTMEFMDNRPPQMGLASMGQALHPEASRLRQPDQATFRARPSRMFLCQAPRWLSIATSTRHGSFTI